MSTPAGTAGIIPGAFQQAADGSLMMPPFPGLSLEYVARPTFSTIVQTAPDRSTARIQLDPYPLWEYDLSFGHLADDPAYSTGISPSNPMGFTPYQQFLGLFCACGGRARTFLMDVASFTRRSSDSRIDSVQIGIGDGQTMAFQLCRNVGGFLDLIDNPTLSTVVVMAGAANAPSQQLPYDTISNGLVTLFNAPAPGTIITASFSWLHRMRFVNDAEELDSYAYQIYTRGNLKLVQERNPSND